MQPNNYIIQDWLFSKAEGKFDIDLGESGIQYHFLHDLDLQKNYDLNYSLDAGKSELRDILAKLYHQTHENVLITHGAQEALYLFYRSFIKEGDHVITFSPGWQQSWEIPKVSGANVSIIQLKAQLNYQININEIESTIKKNTKLIILTNPSNPTGKQINFELGKQLIALYEKNNVFLLLDEEYFFNYSNSFVNRYKNCAVVSSLSKIYGFPGLRIGWFVGPKEIVDQLINYKRYTSVSNSSLCEYLAAQILNHYEHYINAYNEMIKKREPVIKNWAMKHNQLHWHQPDGTPFVYFSINDDISSQNFCEKLLKEFQVLIMPGEVFQDTHALRISFARPTEILNEGLDRITKFINTN